MKHDDRTLLPSFVTSEENLELKRRMISSQSATSIAENKSGKIWSLQFNKIEQSFAAYIVHGCQ
jgi:hypothetical protein